MVEAAELQTQTSDLTPEAFNAFADDIATMFDTTVRVEAADIDQGTVVGLKDKYKKLAAVCRIGAEGALNGTFGVIFDKEGLFTLAGTFVMQPEQIIAQNRRNGTDAEAAEIGDALGEVGNLLVGSWDRVFREEFSGHGHFKQTGTFYGNPWSNVEESIGFSADETTDILTFELTVEPLPPFQCAALYPASLFEGGPAMAEGTSEEESADDQAETDADVPSEEAQETEASQETGSSGEDEAEELPPDEAEERAGEAEDTAGEEKPTAELSPEEQGTSLMVEEAQPEDEPPGEDLAGPVSETISRMMDSAAILPGERLSAVALVHELCAGDVMRKDVAWATPDATIEDIIAKMQQHDTGYVLIASDDRLEGIISKSDVRGALSPYLRSMFVKWRSPMDIATLQIKAKWAMNRPVRTVRPDATLAVVMQTMGEHGGRCMPVVDENGKVLGLVTVFELFRVMLSSGSQTASVGHSAPSAPLV